MSENQEKGNVPSCHGSHSEKSHFGHIAMMILCCLFPIGIIFLIPKIGISPKYSWLVSLICPLMMIGMMVMMCVPRKEQK